MDRDGAQARAHTSLPAREKVTPRPKDSPVARESAPGVTANTTEAMPCGGRDRAEKVTVALCPEDKNMELKSWIDPKNFNPGYLMRSMHLLPKRGDKAEWQHTQDYWAEKDAFPAIDLDDREFVYETIERAKADAAVAGDGRAHRYP